MQSTSTLGRPADRRMEIVRELRRQIEDGTLPPGSQLPTRVEIESRFAVSPLTVQRALQQLREDGFITVNGRQGTYVALNPPHLSNFALVFPRQPSSTQWVGFFAALTRVAAGLPLPDQHRLELFYDINNIRDSLGFEELSQEVMAHRVAGLIFATSPHLLQDTPILDEPGIPRVAIQSAGKNTAYPIVDLDVAAWMARALAFLKARGRRRVAYIGPSQMAESLQRLVALPAAYGLETQSYWWQGIGLSYPEMAQNCAHLLMNPAQTLRPDALILSDDNLVEHALRGLQAAGVQVPHDVEIVAHCNFPVQMETLLPCHRLGFDSRQVLEACIEVINTQRRGEPVAPLTSIAPVFEDELVDSG